jgi:hypothetical protein
MTCKDRYPYLAYQSLETIAQSTLPTPEESTMLVYNGILFPSIYSLDDAGHLFPNKQELNGIIEENIYRQYIQVTWIASLGGLRPKMAFYAEHFLELRDGLIVRTPLTCFDIGCMGLGSSRPIRSRLSSPLGGS